MKDVIGLLLPEPELENALSELKVVGALPWCVLLFGGDVEVEEAVEEAFGPLCTAGLKLLAGGVIGEATGSSRFSGLYVIISGSLNEVVFCGMLGSFEAGTSALGAG